ncbi:WhiB family transcriptional regulator [Streptomyces sp. NPDC005708]|uniref:WhiB family transcriptional regulator n=1 Tax=Streptomyces sp. NPDC005708 TaxID=3154564 RepID=UPI0033F83094
MSRTAQAPITQADPRIPFPSTTEALVCRTNENLFVHEHGQNSPEDIRRVQRAKAACRGCPVAEGCLKWSLANPELTPTGIWAATTAKERKTLRNRLRERLGTDWVGVVAKVDRASSRRRQAQSRPAAAEAAPRAHPMFSSPARDSITPEQQRQNRLVLLTAEYQHRTPRPPSP